MKIMAAVDNKMTREILPAVNVSSGLSSKRRTVWTPSSVTMRWLLFRKLDLLLELLCFFTCTVKKNFTSVNNEHSWGRVI